MGCASSCGDDKAKGGDVLKRTGGCFVCLKTPHVAFLYPGQARIVFLFGARSLKTWSFGLETPGEFFSVLDTWKPASLTRLLPEGIDIC